MNQSSGNDLQSIIKGIEDLKKLMVLLLAKLGSGSNEIGLALKVDSRTVRSWLPFRDIKILHFK